MYMEGVYISTGVWLQWLVFSAWLHFSAPKVHTWCMTKLNRIKKSIIVINSSHVATCSHIEQVTSNHILLWRDWIRSYHCATCLTNKVHTSSPVWCLLCSETSAAMKAGFNGKHLKTLWEDLSHPSSRDIKVNSGERKRRRKKMNVTLMIKRCHDNGCLLLSALRSVIYELTKQW